MSVQSIKAQAVTYIPYTKSFYIGALESGGMSFQGRAEKNYHKIAILKPDKLQKIRDAAGLLTNGPNYDREAAVEYVDNEMVRQATRAAKGKSHQAAVDNVSLQNITRVELLTEIINKQYKDVFLVEGVRRIPVPKLKLDYNVILHIKTRGKGALVPKRAKPEVEAPEFVQASFDLAKFGKLTRIIDTPDEDELTALISPTQTALDDIAQVLSQDENLLIQDEMVKFGDVAGSSWSARTGDFSDNDPLDQISTEIERITKNHGRVNIVATGIRQLGKYFQNSHLIGFTNALDREGQGVGTLPAFPGIKRITDVDIADGVAFIYDQRALSYGEGPMVSESFRDPQAAVSGHIIRKWVEPLIPTILKTAFGTELTGIS